MLRVRFLRPVGVFLQEPKGQLGQVFGAVRAALGQACHHTGVDGEALFLADASGQRKRQPRSAPPMDAALWLVRRTPTQGAIMTPERIAEIRARHGDGEFPPSTGTIISDLLTALETTEAERDEINATLDGIVVYISDTLSGRALADPATYKEWLIEGFLELRDRARRALDASK